MSPGLARMTARAATAVSSAKAASLLADLAGISLTAMRAERAAEAAGAATLHCQEASGRWEEIWQRPHNQTPGADLTTQAS